MAYDLLPFGFPGFDDRFAMLPPAQSKNIKTVFPQMYAFQFDFLFSQFEGAMLVDRMTNIVYGVKGASINWAMVGFYRITSALTGSSSLISLANRKLVLPGGEHAKSWMKGNTLHWTDLQDHPVLPKSGHLQFCRSGATIIESTLEGVEGGCPGISGARICLSSYERVSTFPHLTTLQQTFSKFTPDRCQYPSIISRKSAVNPALNIYGLLNMDPLNPVTGQDEAQVNAMSDYYKILQYFMNPTLRSTFISTNPPNMSSSLLAIANSNPMNTQFYQDLSVPYVALMLKDFTGENGIAKKINVDRARKMLQEATANNKLHQAQTALLYKNSWSLMFPLMPTFLADQAQNNTAYATVINNDVAEWISQVQADNVGQPAEKINSMLVSIQNIAIIGKQGKYWAYALYRYLTSSYFIEPLWMQMQDGNTSQNITNTVKRFTSILEILDTSHFFANRFTRVIQAVQLGSVFPNHLDYDANAADLSLVAKQILEEFAVSYATSPNSNLSQAAQSVATSLANGTIDNLISLFAQQFPDSNGLGGWGGMVNAYKTAALQQYGTPIEMVAEFVALAIASATSSKTSTADNKPVQIISYIKSALGFFVQGASALLIRGITSAAFYRQIASRWQLLEYFVFQDIPVLLGTTFNPVDAYQQSLAQWLIQTTQLGVTPPVTRSSSLAVKIFGRNLSEFLATRFAALMAITGIVLASIKLATSNLTTIDAISYSLALSSATFDLIAAVATWVGSGLAAGTGATVLATIASFAGALSVVATIAGFIVLMVAVFPRVSEPAGGPVTNFVNGEATQFGLFMSLEAAIDGFLPIKDDDDNLVCSGLSLSFNSNSTSSIRVSSGTTNQLSLGSFNFTWNSVFQVNTNSSGETMFTIQPTDTSPLLALTLNDLQQVTLAAMLPDTDAKQAQQLWKANITGAISKDSAGRLLSATFNLYNVYQAKKNNVLVYLSANSNSIVAGSSPSSWLLQMQKTKPEELVFPTLILNTYLYLKKTKLFMSLM